MAGRYRQSPSVDINNEQIYGSRSFTVDFDKNLYGKRLIQQSPQISLEPFSIKTKRHKNTF